MRLIDADSLIANMEERKKIWLSQSEYNDAIRLVNEEPTVEERPHGEWVKEWKEVPITGGIWHQPYWSCPRCGREWEAYSAQFITFCSKCGLELIDGDCEEGESE